MANQNNIGTGGARLLTSLPPIWLARTLAPPPALFQFQCELPYAPRGASVVVRLVFGTAGPKVTPTRKDEYSDPAGLTTQAKLSLSGRRLGLERMLKMPAVSSFRQFPPIANLFRAVGGHPVWRASCRRFNFVTWRERVAFARIATEMADWNLQSAWPCLRRIGKFAWLPRAGVRIFRHTGFNHLPSVT
jgi:hypothetical protein